MKKIRNPTIKKMAAELRDALLKISDNIEETTTKSHLIFRMSVNFARIYTQPRGFWLSVKMPKAELDIPELDVRPRTHPNWTDIRVDEKTDLNLLVKAAKLAYQRTL